MQHLNYKLITLAALFLGLVLVPNNAIAASKSASATNVEASVKNNSGSNENRGANNWSDDEWGDDAWSTEAASPWQNVVKFVEFSWGRRTNTDPVIASDTTLSDARFQLQTTYALSNSLINLRGQVFYDGVQDKWRGQLRELNWQGKLNEKWDLKVGQQVLTWGTGDYLFINDLFAKDWQSFFAGRDDEYLKAPQFAMKASGYYEFANIDLVVTPIFTSDTFINGDVFSFYNPLAAQFNGGNNVAPGFEVAKENQPDDLEFALRIKKQIGNTEYALYGYSGFEKTPASLTQQMQPTFSKLTVIGASAVTQMLGGLVNLEIGQHTIEESEDSGLAFAPDSEFKAMLGYQTELIANLTGSVQFQVEGERTLWTGQLYYRMLKDTATVQWFTFYSPSDRDAYSRLRATYKPIQDCEISAGANVFWQSSETRELPRTFFGQFENASNVFVSARYYF